MKKALTVALPILAVLLGAPTPSQASDHTDGVKTTADNSADLTDLFTFTSPEHPDKLVLMLNVQLFSTSRSRFSDAVDYKFRIRPVDEKTLKPSADARTEQSIVCSFSGGLPIVDPTQQATCKFNFGSSTETVSFATRSQQFTAGGAGEQGGLKVFAGVRSDPWFLDLAKIVAFNNGLPVIKGCPTLPLRSCNGLQNLNVLSIVVEVDKARLSGPLLAITAQTVRK